MTGIKCPQCGSFTVTRIKELRPDGVRKYKCEHGHEFEMSKQERYGNANPDLIEEIEYNKCKLCGERNIPEGRKYMICLDCTLEKLVKARSWKDFKASLLC